MTCLITGAAGFIGFHLAMRLAREGRDIIGIDTLNSYYDPRLKQARLDQLAPFANFRCVRTDVAEREQLDAIFASTKIEHVVHLAAQAGVRYSLTNPEAYIRANIQGFANILEVCRHNAVKHLVYASSSSVYGASTRNPFSPHDVADHPVSLYGATKRSNELFAHSYSHLFGLPTTGLRFFTVYGPWGRPDMALFLFTKAIYEGKPIRVFNNGNMQRDFTYVDDIVEGIARFIDHPATPDPAWSGNSPDPGISKAPFRIYNLGNDNPAKLMELIETLEECIGRKAIKQFEPIQPGDVPATWANVDDTRRDIGFAPSTPLKVGVAKFVEWYRSYHGMSD